MKKLDVLLLMLVFVLLISFSVMGAPINHGEAWDREGWPSIIRIGVLPEEDMAVMRQRYQSLQEHFARVLDLDVELYFGTDFSVMVEAMGFKHIEVSKFGPFSYILASERANAQAIVQGVMNRFAPTYKSYIITNKDTGITTVAHLEGKIFAWVDPASTSGYLFPRAHLIQKTGIENERLDDYFSQVIYSGGHDASVKAVLRGDVHAASVSDSQVQRMIAAGYPGMENIVVVTETLPIPRSPEAVRGDLPQTLKTAITFAYLSFNDEDFLTSHNYHEGFIVVNDEDYDVIRATAEALGLSFEDLL